MGNLLLYTQRKEVRHTTRSLVSADLTVMTDRPSLVAQLALLQTAVNETKTLPYLSGTIEAPRDSLVLFYGKNNSYQLVIITNYLVNEFTTYYLAAV